MKMQKHVSTEELSKFLTFPYKQDRIIDISNTNGFESVGSMVVFENGKPKKTITGNSE